MAVPVTCEMAGAFAPAQAKTHVRHDFVVPEGVARLQVELEIEAEPGEPWPSMLCLSLFDPSGFRGSGHRGGTSHLVLLSEALSTPGYRRGAIVSGAWSAVVHGHRVTAPCRYRIRVRCEMSAGAEAAAGPRWVRGDLHGHTTHSDAIWDVAGMLARAVSMGLDFVTLTDHNTTSQLQDIDRLSGPDLLVMGGIELTTFHGHAVSLGTRDWIDWGVLDPKRTMGEIAAHIAARGGLFVVAHPMAVGDPECTGCHWDYEDMMPGTAPATEIWNGPWSGGSRNEAGLALWYSWLAAGHRIVATAGMDAHGNEPSGSRFGTNVVFAMQRSEGAILQAVKQGHLYISAGPALELTASAAGRTAMMGDTLEAESAAIQVRWGGCPPGSLLRLVRDGSVTPAIEVSGDGATRWEDVQAGSVLVELRDSVGIPLAFTNPVYLVPGRDNGQPIRRR